MGSEQGLTKDSARRVKCTEDTREESDVVDARSNQDEEPYERY
jgi:hypothetical protein